MALALTFAVPATVLLAQSAPPKSAAQLQADQIRELEQFLAVYKKVKSSYVDKVDDKQLMEGAIQGMLASLDPHSGFLEQIRFQQPANPD